METRLDYEVNNRYHLHNILRGDDVRLLDFLEIFADRYKVGKGELIKAFRTQIRGNRCFKSHFTYKLVYLLHRLEIRNFGHILPLFYGHLKTDNMQLQQDVSFRDIVEGHARRETLADLFDSAREEAIKRINAAIVYYDGNVDQAAAMKIIRGESLDTGREGCSVRSIRHTE